LMAARDALGEVAVLAFGLDVDRVHDENVS
jgi:hypothetical protein